MKKKSFILIILLVVLCIIIGMVWQLSLIHIWSQHQNKEVAMKLLLSKLIELKEQEQKENLDELKGDYSQITWGSQIRSYVFHPYTMVKDHRTGAESGNVDAVMDGDLDYFINEKLKQKE